MTFSLIVLAITGVFGGSGGMGGPPSKDKGTLKKWLDRLADALKRLTGETVEALPSIVGDVGFVAEHTWTLTVFVAGLIGIWLMQRVNQAR